MIGGFYAILAGVVYFFGKCFNDAADRNVQNLSRKVSGQTERDKLVDLHMNNFKEFCLRAGRCVNYPFSDIVDFEVAIYQIALREGWHYLSSEVSYVEGKKFSNYFDDSWDDSKWYPIQKVAQALNEETDRREVWKDRCEHGHENLALPMDYLTEMEYQKGVRLNFARRWYKKYEAEAKYYPYSLRNYWEYNSEEEFLKHRDSLIEHYNKYKIYKEAHKSNRYWISLDISFIEKQANRFGLNTPQQNEYSLSDETKLSFVRTWLKNNHGKSQDFEILDEYYEILKQEKAQTLPSPTPENTSEQDQPVPEPNSLSSNITAAEPEPVKPPKTEFVVPPIGYGKTYTMRRGNKKSKLTLTKKV
ncbi:MAG: hypothetical protein ACLR6W_00460 [Evtepia sp.]